MTCNAGCWTLRLGGLVVATSLLTGCAMAGSDPPALTVCPPVIEYSRAFQIEAAEELGMLPDRSAIAVMLSDYAMMREQVRSCPFS